MIDMREVRLERYIAGTFRGPFHAVHLPTGISVDQIGAEDKIVLLERLEREVEMYRAALKD